MARLARVLCGHKRYANSVPKRPIVEPEVESGALVGRRRPVDGDGTASGPAAPACAVLETLLVRSLSWGYYGDLALPAAIPLQTRGIQTSDKLTEDNTNHMLLRPCGQPLTAPP